MMGGLPKMVTFTCRFGRPPLAVFMMVLCKVEGQRQSMTQRLQAVGGGAVLYWTAAAHGIEREKE